MNIFVTNQEITWDNTYPEGSFVVIEDDLISIAPEYNFPNDCDMIFHQDCSVFLDEHFNKLTQIYPIE
jgi:hypothetical protein